MPLLVDTEEYYSSCSKVNYAKNSKTPYNFSIILQFALFTIRSTQKDLKLCGLDPFHLQRAHKLAKSDSQFKIKITQDFALQ